MAELHIPAFQHPPWLQLGTATSRSWAPTEGWGTPAAVDQEVAAGQIWKMLWNPVPSKKARWQKGPIPWEPILCSAGPSSCDTWRHSHPLSLSWVSAHAAGEQAASLWHQKFALLILGKKRPHSSFPTRGEGNEGTHLQPWDQGLKPIILSPSLIKICDHHNCKKWEKTSIANLQIWGGCFTEWCFP